MFFIVILVYLYVCLMYACIQRNMIICAFVEFVKVNTWFLCFRVRWKKKKAKERKRRKRERIIMKEEWDRKGNRDKDTHREKERQSAMWNGDREWDNMPVLLRIYLSEICRT